MQTVRTCKNQELMKRGIDMFSQEIKDLLSEIKTTLNERSVSSRIADGT